jgi:tetratricopeptide (TPR) repeat protein
VLAVEPKNAKALQAKAEILASKQDWKAAEDAMKKLQEAQPDEPVGYYRLGLVYQAQKKIDLALVEFEKAFQKSPKALEPLAAMTGILVSQGKFDKAITHVNQALQAVPNSVPAQLLLGEVYSMQKKFAEAESIFRKVIQANPKVSAAYGDLAKLHLSRDDPKAAIQTLQQGLAAMPGDGGMSAFLAEIYQRTGEVDKAIAIYEGMLRANPNAEVVANNLASLLTDSKGDKASLDRALELAKRFESSSKVGFMDTLGWVYYKQGQYDKAMPFFQKAVERMPQAAIFQYHLGMVLYKKGDVAGAKQHLKLAVDSKAHFPGMEEAKATLSKL